MTFMINHDEIKKVFKIDNKIIALTPLKGGANNKVYKIEIENTPPVILKKYFKDTRNRLVSEFSFLSYAWNQNIRNIPKPLSCNKRLNMGLYSFIDADHYNSKVFSPSFIDDTVLY